MSTTCTPLGTEEVIRQFNAWWRYVIINHKDMDADEMFGTYGMWITANDLETILENVTKNCNGRTFADRCCNAWVSGILPHTWEKEVHAHTSRWSATKKARMAADNPFMNTMQSARKP